MHLLCPHCHNPIELVRVKAQEGIRCSSCGSSFRVEGDHTTASEPPVGRKLGRFVLQGTVGHGAFGTVYKARDSELDRTVAIKVPRAGSLATAQELDRLTREARSVAQLRHPGIVSVHEVGQHENLPFIISDFVEGHTLADLLSARRPAPREAAELIAQVADALQYAHDHGVVHRDVKPSNVMLENGAPRLMDFGLAKRDAGEITMTLDGQVLGTPAYMSPEQARGEAHRVDGRSDVYSLGVILYQMLTGELPFRGTTRMLLDQVLDEEPRPPRRLNDRLPRDLETVCLKCLQKEPAKRYPAARGLADDLRRFLKGEVIQARPVGRLEKAWRLCRRNPITASLTAALFAALAGGATLSTLLWLQARANYAEAETQRVLADENFREAVQAVEDYFNRVTQNKLLDSKVPGMQPLRRDLLESALKYYQRFAAQHAHDPALRLELAKAYGRMGYLVGEIGSQEEALELQNRCLVQLQALAGERARDASVREPLAAAYHYVGELHRNAGRTKASVDCAQQAVALSRELLTESPTDIDRQRALSRACNGLGYALDRADQPEGALGAYQEGIVILERMVAVYPNNADYLSSLAGTHHNVGVVYQDTLSKPQEAIAAFQRALALEEKAAALAPYDMRTQDYLAKHIHCLGVVYDNGLKQGEPALARFEQALTIREKLVRENPAVHELRAELAFSYRAIGRLRRLRGEHERAAVAFDQALHLLERLVTEQATIPEYRRILALTYASLGHMHLQTGFVAQALVCHRRAVVLQRKLAQDHPDRLLYRGHLALYLGNLGSLEPEVGSLSQARATLAEAVQIAEELERRQYKDADFTSVPARHRALSAELERESAKAEARLQQLIQALAADTDRQGESGRNRILDLQSECFILQFMLGRKEEALTTQQNALDSLERAIRDHPADLEYRRARFSCLVHSARTYRDLGRPEEALAAARQALLAWYPPLEGQPVRLCDLAGARALCSTLLAASENPPSETTRTECSRLRDLAMEALKAAFAKGLKDAKQLQNDLDLEPLWPRADYKQLVKNLSTRAKAEPKTGD